MLEKKPRQPPLEKPRLSPTLSGHSRTPRVTTFQPPTTLSVTLPPSPPLLPPSPPLLPPSPNPLSHPLPPSPGMASEFPRGSPKRTFGVRGWRGSGFRSFLVFSFLVVLVFAQLAADARRDWFSSLGRSPHKNGQNDLDDQTRQELEKFSTSKQSTSAKRH